MRQRRPYVNHDEARQVLSRALAADGPRLITVRADSGKGKSTLLSWFEDECQSQDTPCASLTFREVRSFDAFQVLDALAQKLKGCKFKEYQKRVREHMGAAGAAVTIQNVTLDGSQISGIQAIASDPTRRRYVLAQLTDAWLADVNAFAARRRRVVLMLDTFEEASDEVKMWLGNALQSLRETTNVLLLVAGREKVTVDAARWGDECCELELPAELEYHWWREYAEGTGALGELGEKMLQRYHKKFRGDPKMMSILCDPETS